MQVLWWLNSLYLQHLNGRQKLVLDFELDLNVLWVFFFSNLFVNLPGFFIIYSYKGGRGFLASYLSCFSKTCPISSYFRKKLLGKNGRSVWSMTYWIQTVSWTAVWPGGWWEAGRWAQRGWPGLLETRRVFSHSLSWSPDSSASGASMDWSGEMKIWQINTTESTAVSGNHSLKVFEYIRTKKKVHTNCDMEIETEWIDRMMTVKKTLQRKQSNRVKNSNSNSSGPFKRAYRFI